MAASFKHISPRPADYVEPTAPPFGAPISPERDAEESKQLRLRSYRRSTSILLEESEVPRMSAKEMAAAERRLGLPTMNPKGRDNLCTLPGKKWEWIHPHEKSKPLVSRLCGTESVRRAAHELSAKTNYEPRPRRIGIDRPWAPDALASDSVREAHKQYAARWWRDGARDTIALPDWDLPAETGVYKPPRTRPMRPIGVFDPAEVLYYAHEERKRYLQKLIGQKRWPRERAVAAVLEDAGSGRSWEEMEGEAETAEMVLTVDGKLLPLPRWSPKPPAPEFKKKKASKGKGKAKATLASSSSSASAATTGFEGRTSTTSATPATQDPCLERAHPKRIRELSEKAKKIPRGGEHDEHGEEDEDPAKKRARL